MTWDQKLIAVFVALSVVGLVVGWIADRRLARAPWAAAPPSEAPAPASSGRHRAASSHRRRDE